MLEMDEGGGNNCNHTIMAAMATLSSGELLHLSLLLSADHHRRCQRLSTVLSSPSHFSLTLRRLNSLTLSHKSLLLARHLLSSLRHLTIFLSPATAASATLTPPPTLTLRDYDAVSLLLLLCELCHHHPNTLHSSPSHWRSLLRYYFATTLLSISGVGVAPLISCVERVGRCRRLLAGISGEVVAAAAAAVVRLPSVEGKGGECAVCRECMGRGRDVCQLPCNHMFHWSCILPWMKKTNTCPCCRFMVPTDDVFGEIRRLWEVIKVAGAGGDKGTQS